MENEIWIMTKTLGAEVDAFTTFGIVMADTALSALITPPPMKDLIESKFRSIPGKYVINDTPLFDERELTLPFQMYARATPATKEMRGDIIYSTAAQSAKANFMTNYTSFCNKVLADGQLRIRTRYQGADTGYNPTDSNGAYIYPQDTVYYRCIYTSCTQFSEFNGEYASFSLKLVEINPADRGATSSYDFGY